MHSPSPQYSRPGPAGDWQTLPSYYAPASLAELWSGGATGPPHFTQELREHEHRPAWQAALACCAAGTAHQPPAQDWALALASVAQALGFWRVARTLLRQCTAQQPVQGAALVALARLCARTGGAREALHLLRHPQASTLPDGADLRDTLRQRHWHWCQLGWYPPQGIRAGRLALEPMGPEHCHDVLQCHRDVQMVQMAGFPQFNTAQRYAQWLEEERVRPGAIHLAVMDRDEGFAGLVGGIRIGDTASFHFWISAHLRGRGLGPQAARLLFSHLQALQVRSVVTVVLAHNKCSLRAMQHLGLQRLPLRALEPYAQMVPFGMPLGQQPVDLAELSWLLMELFKAVHSPVKFG